MTYLNNVNLNWSCHIWLYHIRDQRKLTPACVPQLQLENGLNDLWDQRNPDQPVHIHFNLWDQRNPDQPVHIHFK